MGWRHPTCVALVLCVVGAQQMDPIALQKRAVQRLDAFVDHFRRTGDFQSRMAEVVQAEAELAASNQALVARGDFKALATGLMKQGTTYRIRGDWATAINLYRLAVQAAQRANDPAQQADAMAWGAFTESQRKNLGQAAVDAAAAVRLAETAGDPDVFARALDVLGTIQLAQLDLTAAADTLNREVKIAEQARDPITPYYAYLNRSDVYAKLAERCDYQRTFDACYQAIERANADLQQAIDIVRRLGYAGLVRQTEGFVSTLEVRRAMIKSQQRTDIALEKAGVFHPRTAKDVLVTERFVATPGDVPPALTAIYQASLREQQAAGPFAASDARTHFTDGMMNEMRGNNDAALASFMKAVDALERDRRMLRDERSRGTFMEDRINFYYAPVQQLLERRRYDQAFELVERSRSRALADLLASRTPGLQQPEEQKLYSELMTLRTRIADAQGRLLELVSDPKRSTNSAQAESLQKQIRLLETQYDEASARIAAQAPRLSSLVESTPATLSAFQQALREERSEALQYLVLEHALLVWHITPTSVTVKNVFLPRSELMSKVAALRTSVSDRSSPFDEKTARELFLYLIAPVLPQIRAERLVVLPHEDLHYVPFQVLQDPADGRYAGERFQFTYAPGASVFLRLRKSPGLAGGRLLAVADPSLQAAGEEVAAIAKMFPGQSRVLSGTLARERDIKTLTGEFDVIHLSVHGKFDGAEPLLSHLVLAGGGGDDGKLTAAEMFGLPLVTSRLVVLSACETGRAEATHANEVLGMVRALMYAGAGTLVLSHWEVDSAATSRWMQAFYAAGRSRPLPEAARTALQTVKAIPEYRHPYYWGAFTMIGR